MRVTKWIVCPVVGLVLFLLLSVANAASAVAAPTLSSPINSSTGSHIENAITLSGGVFPSGAPAVVVTSVSSFNDSLSAAVLAKAYNGPLLLTSSSSLTATVATELKRLKPARVYVVGLSSSVLDQVRTVFQGVVPDVEVVSISGSDRYETARLIAVEVKAKLGAITRVVIAPGDGYQGAVVACALAAAEGWPILFTPTAGPFPQASADAIAEIGAKSGIAVGTNVNPSIPGFTITKAIVGTSSPSDPDGRYDASYKLAEYACSQGWSSYDQVGLAPGSDFADAAVLAPCLARGDGILLLSTASGLPGATITAIKSRAKQITRVQFVGLGWAVYRQVKSLNSPCVTGLNATCGPVGGGNSLVVTGSGLNEVTEVSVGRSVLPRADWRIDSSTQLTILSTPAGAGVGPVEVIVTNFWGRSPAGTKDIYTYTVDSEAWAGDKVVQEALKYVGVPYVWGGAGPTNGFDCSGLVMYVYGKLGIILPHYSRSQATYGTAVNKEDLKPGDLVFFYAPVSHVGIYVGGGMMIDAPRSGDLVTIENAYRSSYTTARRVVSPYTRYEQGDSTLRYTGTWSTNSSASSASGGSFRYVNTSGASVTVTFAGTSLIWITKKSPLYGIGSVSLDGGSAVPVDLYSATEVWQQRVWQTGTLASGTHTVTISWTGQKNPSATNTNIGVDAFDILGTMGQAPAATTTTLASTTTTAAPSTTTSVSATTTTTLATTTTAPVTTTTTSPVTTTTTTTAPTTPTTVTDTPARYEQGNSKLVYAGPWKTNASAPCASGGSFSYVNSPEASVTVKFNGTSLAWLAKKGSVYGKAKVTLDGGTPVTVDLYSWLMLWKGKVWQTGTITPGVHTVKIEWTGAKNAKALNTNIGVDAFDIAGTLTAISSTATTTPPGTTTPTTVSPASARHEQNNSKLLYTGAWSTNPSASKASGCSFKYSDSSGSSVTVKFTGTYLAWITKKSPVYGVAKVTVDGGTAPKVDLYSASEIWQQKVWDTGVLASGTHTVMIEWTGDKNPAAIAANVGVDAFDVIGTLGQASNGVGEPSGLVVVIDPGHQARGDSSLEPIGPGSSERKAKVSGGTIGAVTGTPESELALVIGLKLRDSLSAHGVEVVMTRTSQDVNISNIQRAQIANDAGAALFVRVHANGAASPSVSGIYVLYPTSIAGWTDDIAVASKNAATLALQEMVASTGATNRGLSARSDMTGFNWSDVPVILPEIGFMTNAAEDRSLATAAYQDKIVQGLTRAILSILGVS